MKIILLSGWSTSGKDTVGKILEKNHRAVLFAFADVLKEIVAKEFEFPIGWAYSEEGKHKRLPNGKTVREMLIKRGQEIRKEKGTEYFAQIVANQIQILTSMSNSDQIAVVTDWRLPIELETLQKMLKHKIYTVRIQRRGQLKSPIKDSETESQLDAFPFDFFIDNEGISLESLQNEVDAKLKDILNVENEMRM
jgi:hypothetical protein